MTFAALVASDAAPGHAPDVDPALADRHQLFAIGRATWSLGRSSYVGVLATDTELGSGHNRVLGSDVSLRHGPHNWSATLLGSQSRAPLDGAKTSGLAGQATYTYETKRWVFVTQGEHYDRDFQMDTAFLKQTAITCDWSYLRLNLYPDEKKHAWFKSFSPFVFTRAGRDRIQGGDVYFGLVGMQANFTRQGFLRLDAGWGQEPWAQRELATRMARVISNAQIVRWLSYNVYLDRGRSVYYDSENPFVGASWYHSLGLTLQPATGFSQSISWERSALSHTEDGARVYRVDLLNLKTVLPVRSALRPARDRALRQSTRGRS